MDKSTAEHNVVVGEGVCLEGTISVPGKLTVYGEFKGTISANHIVVASTGVIAGSITANIADISGNVSDMFTVNGKLHLRSGSIISGNVEYISLEVENGTQLNASVAKISMTSGTATLVESTQDPHSI